MNPFDLKKRLDLWKETIVDIKGKTLTLEDVNEWQRRLPLGRGKMTERLHPDNLPVSATPDFDRIRGAHTCGTSERIYQERRAREAEASLAEFHMELHRQTSLKEKAEARVAELEERLKGLEKERDYLRHLRGKGI